MTAMSDSLLTDSPHTNTSSSNGNGVAARNGNGNGGSLRHVLDFEKPIAKLELQIHELESLQVTKQVDYTKELRQLRTNYTSLLRKTYENLTPWETVQVAR